MTKAENTAGNKNKRAVWTRTVDIIFRTAHVAMAGVLFGGAVLNVSVFQLVPWKYLTIATGLVLVASEIYHRPHWLYQARGVMAIIHVILFGLIRLLPDFAVPFMAAAIAFGMIGSHMPRRLRFWSFLLRKTEDY